MKKILCTAALLLALISCKKEAKIPEDEITPAPVREQAVSKTECYQVVLKQDTITLSIDSKGNEVPSGKLTYNFFEKDKSDGTLSGIMKGDTLFANYIFTAEGKTSQREVVFLKKGDTFAEGYGELTDDGTGKITFKDKSKLDFQIQTPMHLIECKKESLKY
jgi:hypothetical protein